jgi:hypothetical protein
MRDPQAHIAPASYELEAERKAAAEMPQSVSTDSDIIRKYAVRAFAEGGGRFRREYPA